MANSQKRITLPGLNKQFEFLKRHLELNGKQILIIGEKLFPLALEMEKSNAYRVELISQSQDDLTEGRLLLKGTNSVIKLMEYEATDYQSDSFDIVYAQASLNIGGKNAIIKEIKRILKSDGYLCTGEVVALREEIPQFMTDIWKRSGIDPIFVEKFASYYEERGFEKVKVDDLSYTLKRYYSEMKDEFKEGVYNLTESQKKAYKKVISRYKHEIDAFNKLGGDKFAGFFVGIFKLK